MDTHPARAKTHPWLPPILSRFLLIPSSLALGIALRHYIPGSASLIIPLFILATLLLLTRPSRTFGILLLLITLGIYRTNQHYPNPEQNLTCTGHWQLRDFPTPNHPIGERLKLTYLNGDCPQLQHKTITLYRYSSQHAILGDTYPLTLNLRNSTTQYYASTNSTPIPITAPIPLSVRSRLWLHNRIQHTFPQQAAWIEALIIGNRSALSAENRQILQTTGTAHLLAISGLHLAIIIATFYLSTRHLTSFIPILHRYASPQSYAYLISLIAGLIYALITGAQTPILRAWLMFACLLLNWFIPNPRRHYALPLAATLILLLTPEALFQLGTWLSFIATAAVLISYQKHRHRHASLDWLRIQLTTTLSLTPLIWAAFGGIPLIALPLNLIIIPWLAPLLTLIIATLAYPTPWLIRQSEHATSLYLNTIEQSAHLPYHYLSPNYQPSIIAGTLLSLTLLTLCIRQAKILSFPLGFSALIALIFPFLHTPNLNMSHSRLHYLDPRHVLIINAGKRVETIHRSILPELRHRALIPTAIILTEAHSTAGLALLHNTYPNTPIYTTYPMPELTIPHQYCPEHTPFPQLQFTRDLHCHWTTTP